MTLTQLKYFCEIAKTGSFTLAANNLYVAQSSVSFAIRELESELHVPLFVRSANKKVELTQYGEMFLSYAQNSLDSLSMGRALIDERLNPDSGKVRIGLYINVADSLLPWYVNGFYRENPDVKIDIDLDINYSWIEDMHEKLLRGNYDFVISSSGDQIQNCGSRQIATQRVKLLIPKDHPLAAKKSVSLEEIKNYTLLCVSPNSYMDTYIKRLFAGINCFPRIVYSRDWTTILTEVAIGKGIALSTMLPINPTLLTYIDVDTIEDTRNIFLSWATNRTLSEPAKKLLKYFVSTAEKYGPDELIF